jgi:hypothetical protein
VLATVGFFIATIHYVVGSPTALAQGFFGGSSETCHAIAGQPPVCTSSGAVISPWSPALALGLLGFWLVLLGMLGRRRTAATLAPPPA